MPEACVISDKMSGSVGHHNSHIIGYVQVIDRYRRVEKGKDEDGEPIYEDVPVYRDDPVYCAGHDVTGEQAAGQSKFMIQGKAAATVGDTGTSTCPCCGKGYTNTKGSSKVFINGRAAVRLGDEVDIHGEGTGTMTSGNAKVNFA